MPTSKTTAENHNERYEVVVGNVGTIYRGNSKRQGLAEFREASQLSKDGYGRYSMEPVTLFEDGEILKEHDPNVRRWRIAVRRSESVIKEFEVTGNTLQEAKAAAFASAADTDFGRAADADYSITYYKEIDE